MRAWFLVWYFVRQFQSLASTNALLTAPDATNLRHGDRRSRQDKLKRQPSRYRFRQKIIGLRAVARLSSDGLEIIADSRLIHDFLAMLMPAIVKIMRVSRQLTLSLGFILREPCGGV